MGDIVQAGQEQVTISVSVLAHAGVQRIELRNGSEVLETIRTYAKNDLGNRIRCLWSGAEYRGRGRETFWRGQVQFKRAKIGRFEPINHWNPERLFEQTGESTIVFDTLTTGNFMGFDAWIDAEDNSEIDIATSLVNENVSIDKVGLEDLVFDAGGLERKISLFRLPEENLRREISFERTVALEKGRDSPLWVCVTTEDGYQAWSSPIYVFD